MFPGVSQSFQGFVRKVIAGSSFSSKEVKLLKWIFANNFKTLIGSLCVYGLFGLPFVLAFDDTIFHPSLKYLGFIGRFITMIAEIWLCRSYLLHVVEKDEEENQKKN